MHFQSFLNYLTHEKRFSPHTIEAYRTDISQFYAFLKASNNTFTEDNLSAITHNDIREWLYALKNPPSGSAISSRSINRKISSLRSFYRFLIRKGIVKHDPMLKIKAPKAEQRLPVYLEQGEMEQLFAYMQRAEGFEQVRDRLIMELLYATGMRRAELIGLREADMDLGSGQIKILGKGNKERIIPVNDDLVALISAYLELKREHFDVASDHVIVTNKGAQLYPRFVNTAVSRMIGMVSAISKKSPHVLRHSFATHLLNNGSPLNAIKELLGHSSLAATQVYTHGKIEELKAIYNQSHPKS